MRHGVFVGAVLLCHVFTGLSDTVTISNVRPRLDVNGFPMDVHDGTIVQFNQTSSSPPPYLWYGMGYTNCTERTGIIPPLNCPGIYDKFGDPNACGFLTTHHVNLYSSPNLVDWTFHGDVLPASRRPYGIYFRPKVLYNRFTGLYVMWVNYLPPASTPLSAYSNATYVVATSPSPYGPFSVVRARSNVTQSGGGDLTLFSDSNGVGYIAYDAWSNNHRVSIERLTPDYLDSTGNTTGPISPSSHEAPIVFQRRGVWYLMFGHTCCFCEGGAGSNVWTAASPMGPWTDSGVDLNPQPNPFRPHPIPAQENTVIQVRLEDGSNDFLYSGDLWDSAPGPQHFKSEDRQYWVPLVFNDSASPPTVSPLAHVDNFTINVFV